MLFYSYVEKVLISFFYKFNILFQGKEGPANTTLMPAKLRAVLVCAESDSDTVLVNFGFSNNGQKYLEKSTCGPRISWRQTKFVWLSAVLINVESLISRISSQKRISKPNYFTLFIRGLGGLIHGKKWQKISWHCHFKASIILWPRWTMLVLALTCSSTLCPTLAAIQVTKLIK